MRFLRRVFFKGLIAVLPVALTVFLVVWLARSFESILGRGIKAVIPEEYYVPGLGVATGILLILAVGLMLEGWFTRQLWSLGERLLDRMPLVREVFGAFKQVVSYASSGSGPAATESSSSGRSTRSMWRMSRTREVTRSVRHVSHARGDSSGDLPVSARKRRSVSSSRG